MALEGTIRDFSVADLMQTLGQHKQTGVLIIKSKETFITIYFDKGSIVNVESFPQKIEYKLGETLLKKEIITKDILEKTLKIQKKTGKRLGEILLDLNIISKEELKKGLTDQAIRIIMNMINWKQGYYKFQKKDFVDWDKEWFEPISTDHILMESMKMLDELPIIKEKIPDSSIVFKYTEIDKEIEILSEMEDEKTSDTKAYITENEYKILKLVDGIRDVEEIIDKMSISEFEVYRGLFNLLKKGLIEQKLKKSDLEKELEESRKASKKKFFDVIKFFIVSVFILFGIFSLIQTSFFKKNIFYPLDLNISDEIINERIKINNNYMKMIKNRYFLSEQKK